MLKKIVVVAVFCLSLMTIGGTEANALSLSGRLFIGYNTIHCYSFWKGIGNADLNDVYVQCEVQIVEAKVPCKNFGGGTGGEGIVFNFINDDLNGFDFFNDNLEGKGKTPSDVTFTDTQTFCTLFDGEYDYENDICDNYNTTLDDAICINPNWSVLTPAEGGYIDVTKLYASVYGYKYVGAEPSDEGHVYCELEEVTADDGTVSKVYACVDCAYEDGTYSCPVE